MLKWILGIVLLILFLVCLGIKIFDRDRRLSIAPCGMGINKVLYAEEQSWGIGLPGDNETGVIVFELPDVVSEQIEIQGIGYLESITCPVELAIDRRGKYDRWQKTPILNGKEWRADAVELNSYLDHYGFGIEINKTIELEINGAISGEGNFFSFGRTGIIVLAPRTNRAYYFYAG
ncbi:hypothetical protein [Agrobacterium sp. NPDC090283]|uniref:hypothetical protein n=1 Tax=Agrobacterium sp. NPDC090283 TaxID=3363920 RepID=UPI00383BAAA5